MTTFMRQLGAFANSYSLTIIVSRPFSSPPIDPKVTLPATHQVINNSTRMGPRNTGSANPEAVFESDRKPALGPSFTFMTDTTLWLSRRPPGEQQEEGAMVHVAEVFRSRNTVRWILCTGA